MRTCVSATDATVRAPVEEGSERREGARLFWSGLSVEISGEALRVALAYATDSCT